MARALTVKRTVVTRAEREKFRERIRRLRSHYTQMNCRFWVFEEAALPGAYLEFCEAPDAATLARAHQGAPDATLDPSRIYVEVEIA